MIDTYEKPLLTPSINRLEDDIAEYEMITGDLQREIFQIEEDEKNYQQTLESEHKEKIDVLRKENDTLRKKLQTKLLNK